MRDFIRRPNPLLACVFPSDCQTFYMYFAFFPELMLHGQLFDLFRSLARKCQVIAVNGEGNPTESLLKYLSKKSQNTHLIRQYGSSDNELLQRTHSDCPFLFHFIFLAVVFCPIKYEVTAVTSNRRVRGRHFFPPSSCLKRLIGKKGRTRERQKEKV